MKTKQNKTKTKQKTKPKTKQNKTKQNKTKQNKTKQNKTKQNKNKTKQNKTKRQHQNIPTHDVMHDIFKGERYNIFNNYLSLKLLLKVWNLYYENDLDFNLIARSFKKLRLIKHQVLTANDNV